MHGVYLCVVCVARPYQLALTTIFGDSLSDDTPHVLGGAQGEALETLKDRKASQKFNAPGRWGRCFEFKYKTHLFKQTTCMCCHSKPL